MNCIKNLTADWKVNEWANGGWATDCWAKREIDAGIFVCCELCLGQLAVINLLDGVQASNEQRREDDKKKSHVCYEIS